MPLTESDSFSYEKRQPSTRRWRSHINDDRGAAVLPLLPPTAPERLPLPRFNRVLTYMHTRLGENISLERLAAQSGYSLYHFIRLFRTATGETPHQYLAKLRIERAMTLLVETDQSVTAIAFALGFNSSQHFAKRFRQFTKCSPSHYRRRQRAAIATSGLTDTALG